MTTSTDSNLPPPLSLSSTVSLTIWRAIIIPLVILAAHRVVVTARLAALQVAALRVALYEAQRKQQRDAQDRAHGAKAGPRDLQHSTDKQWSSNGGAVVKCGFTTGSSLVRVRLSQRAAAFRQKGASIRRSRVDATRLLRSFAMHTSSTPRQPSHAPLADAADAQWGVRKGH